MKLKPWKVYVFLDVVTLMAIFIALPLYPQHSTLYNILLISNSVLLLVLGTLLVILEDVIREEILRRSRTLQ